MAAIDLARDLLTDLGQRNLTSEVLNNYYVGQHPNVWAHKKASDKYRRLLAQSVTNFPLLIVDSVNDRLVIDGFRLDAADADEFVWSELWQRNRMDVYAAMVHQQALVTGYSYVSVWPDDQGRARIRGESALECYHEPHPDDPMRVRYAVKVWADTRAKTWHLILFEEDRITRMSTDFRGYAPSGRWDRTTVDSLNAAKWNTDSVEDNPMMGTVPVVPFLNRPRLDGTGFSELADIIPVFDRIDTLTSQLLMAGELGAFKIRWATGIDVPEDATGNKVEPFDVALDRLWVSENETAKFGSFDATDLKPYAEAIDQAIQQAAAVSRTPPFLLLGKLTNLSAEALKATESGLVQKVKNRMSVYGESWETVIKLGLACYNDPRAELSDLEVIWRDPENVSEAQRVDALTKLYAIGLPQRAVWEKWGASPDEIARWEAMRSEDVFMRMMLSSAEAVPGLSAQAPADQAGQPVDQAQQADAPADQAVQ